MIRLTILLHILSSCQQTVTIETSFSTETTITIDDSIHDQSNFEAFYQKFIADSTYQINHVQWPLEGSYVDYETEKIWTKENWRHINWDYKEKRSTEFDNISINENDSIVKLSYHCLDCGFSFELRFKKIIQEWVLVHRQENNY